MGDSHLHIQFTKICFSATVIPSVTEYYFILNFGSQMSAISRPHGTIYLRRLQGSMGKAKHTASRESL